MVELQDSSVHLVVTFPPYWVLKKYDPTEGQLGTIQDYSEFLSGYLLVPLRHARKFE